MRRLVRVVDFEPEPLDKHNGGLAVIIAVALKRQFSSTVAMLKTLCLLVGASALALAPATTHASELEPSVLAPCSPSAAGNPVSLAIWSRIQSGLGLDRPPTTIGESPIVRVLVTPGWDSEPEWAVTIYRPDAEPEDFVEVVRASAGLTATAYELKEVSLDPVPTYETRVVSEPEAVPTTLSRRRIERELSERIVDVLKSAVESSRFSNRPIVLHPTTFHFVVWITDAGLICGESQYAPSEGVESRLRSLAKELASVAENESDRDVVAAGVESIRMLLANDS